MSIEIKSGIEGIKAQDIFYEKAIYMHGLEYAFKRITPQAFLLCFTKQPDGFIFSINNSSSCIGLLLLSHCNAFDYYCYIDILLKENKELNEDIMKAVIEFIFKQTFNKICLDLLIRNKPYRDIAKNMGFRSVGTHIQHRYTGKKYIDVQEFELLKENWIKRNK